MRLGGANVGRPGLLCCGPFCHDGAHAPAPCSFPAQLGLLRAFAGGIASGHYGAVFCSQPAPAPAEAAGPAESDSDAGSCYVGLLVCREGAPPLPAQCPYRGGCLSVQGMSGGLPLLTRLLLARDFGTIDHGDHGESRI